MKPRKLAYILSAFLLMLVAASGVSALTMTVGNGSGEATETVVIPITVDVPTGIAGAAFTVTYDPTKITLTLVQSTFFDTFANQWNGLNPVPNPLPPTSVDVGDPPVTYTQPLLTNDITTGTMIAAARCTPAGAGNSVLFSLSFVLNQGIRPGTYTIGVASSIINNTAAGYDENGETIPMLIGADASLEVTDPNAFPILLDPPHTIGNTVAGSVTFNDIDSDGDGIGDFWETENFGNLTTADASSDYDQDGYSDRQEYLNQGAQDPNGDDFDPVAWKNAVGGAGYDETTRVEPGDLDNNSDVSLDDVRGTFTIFLGGPFTPQEFAAANVCDDGDGHSTISLNDVRGAFTLFLGGIPCQ